MRLFEYSIACAFALSLVSESLAVSPASPSFSDLAKQVQKEQLACKQGNSYDPSCIQKISADYAALYQAVTPLAAQTIDPKNPLATLAQTQLQQYQKIKTDIETNALALMNGTTTITIPDGLLGSSVTAGAVGSPPVAASSAATPKHCLVTGDSPSTSSNMVTYTFKLDCPDAAPSAIAVSPIPGKVGDQRTTPSNLQGLIAPQFGSDRKSLSFTVQPNSAGQSFQLILPSAAVTANGVRGNYYIATGGVAITDCEEKPTTQGCLSGALQMPAVPEHAVDQLFQGLAGVAVSGASATDPRTTFLAEGKLDLPLTSNKSNNIAAKFDLTVYAKIGALGTLSDTSSLFSTTTSAFTSVVSQPPEKIVQSYEMGASLGWRIPHTFWRIGDNLLTLNLIGAGGMLTPLSPSQAPSVIYKATDTAVQMYFENNGANNNASPPLTKQFATACSQMSNGMTEPCYVQVFPADRQQFFRYYGGGLRLKFYVKDTTSGHSEYRFPGNLDLAVGQNEYVTGGKLHGTVLHFGGEIPIPGVDYLYLNLGMDSSFNKTNPGQNAPLLLTPGTATTPDPATVVNVFQPQPSRDRYSVGVSFDIAHLLSPKSGMTPSAPAAPNITSQPTSQAIASGSTATLAVTATGTGTLTYQWYKGKSGDQSNAIAGANAASYKIDPPPTTDELTAGQNYWVQVTNTVNGTGTTANSNTATITLKQ